MKLTSSLKLVKPTPHPFTVACLATLLTALGLFVVWKSTDETQNRADAYGASLAAGLAQLTIDPLMERDRITLSVLANRTLASPQVSGVAVYTIDNHLLAASGQTENGPHYTEPIRFDDSIMGYVRVSLKRSQGPPSMLLILLGIVTILLAPLVTVGALSVRYAGKHAARPDTALVSEITVRLPDELEHHHLVAVNLYNQISMTRDARKAELDHANVIAKQVAGLYYGEVRSLPGTGLLVHFHPSTDADRALQVLCATFVLVELLGAYRLGVHSVGLPAGAGLGNDRAEIADVARLSALAKHRTVAVSGSFPLDTLRDDQLHRQPLQHPLLEELHTVPKAYLVAALSPAQQALVTQQVRHLSDQWGSTASESTF
ncbi:MAG: hypothetical protein O7B25_10280 [Gammaproteobacteria bacterium]|nr:hypothetical protein [Gammaproteobacteria bacterium]